MSERHIPGVAVLASGSGSTLEAFIHAAEAGIVDAEIGLVISNNSNVGVFDRIRRLNKQYGLNIETLHISGKTHPGSAAEIGAQTLPEAEAIHAAIAKENFVLIALMGYMKKIAGTLLDAYGWKPDMDVFAAQMFNTHPGPLPQTRGLFGINVQKAVLETGMDHSAHTVHAVGEGYDTGPIVVEHQVPVLPNDTPESLFEAVQLTEKSHLPVDIRDILDGKKLYGDS